MKPVFIVGPPAHGHHDPARHPQPGPGQPGAAHLGADVPVAAAGGRGRQRRSSRRGVSGDDPGRRRSQSEMFKAMHPMGADALAGVRRDDGRDDVHAAVPQPVPRARRTRTGSTPTPTGRPSTPSTAGSSSTCWWHKPGDRWMLKTGAHMWGLAHLLRDLSRRADRLHAPRPGEVGHVVRQPHRAGAVAWAATRSTRSRSPPTGRRG